MVDMEAAIITEVVQEETVFLQEEAVIKVHANLGAMPMLLYLLEIWHSKQINKKLQKCSHHKDYSQ
jgi:hypothetical protein